jgi:hypothetical protein
MVCQARVRLQKETLYAVKGLVMGTVPFPAAKRDGNFCQQTIPFGLLLARPLAVPTR